MMGYTDYGIQQYGSFLMGLSPTPPNYLEFGTGSSQFDGTKKNNDAGFVRKPITWRWNGTNPQGNVSLLTTDAVGSNIQEVGMGPAVTVGSNLFTRDLSVIGDKDTSFTVTLNFESRLSRP